MGLVLDTIHRYHFHSQAGHDDPLERIAVLEALDARGDRKMLIAKAAQLLGDQTDDVRHRAAELLAAAGGSDAAEAAASLLESPDDHAREAAVSALTAIGKPAAPATSRRLEHPLPIVRLAALQVLANMPAQSVVGDVARRLGDSDPEVVIEAVRVLGRHQAVEYLPELRYLYKKLPETRVAVIEALRLIDPHEGLDLLENALQQGDLLLRDTALETLRAMDSPRVRKLLRDAESQPN